MQRWLAKPNFCFTNKVPTPENFRITFNFLWQKYDDKKFVKTLFLSGGGGTFGQTFLNFLTSVEPANGE